MQLVVSYLRLDSSIVDGLYDTHSGITPHPYLCVLARIKNGFGIETGVNPDQY